MSDLTDIVRRFAGKRVLVLGDVCVDTFIDYRVSERVNPEAPAVPIWVAEESYKGGGMAATVVSMVCALGARCHLLPAPQDWGEFACHRVRVKVGGKPLARIDHDAQSPNPVRLPDSFEKADLILLADHGKGWVDAGTVYTAVQRALEWDCPVIADPASGSDWAKYQGVTAIKCNTLEWLDYKAQKKFWWPETLVVTRGELGCELWNHFQQERGYYGARFNFETRPLQDANAIGAGDQFIAALGLAKCSGANWEEACKIANAAARVKCGKPMTNPCEVRELVEELERPTPEEPPDRDWWVYSTALADGVLLVQCRKTKKLGSVDNPTREEWARAFHAPSNPYPWTEPERVREQHDEEEKKHKE